MREAWKPLHAGETDAALVRNQFVPELLEKGFNKLYDFVEDTKPHGRPDRVTVARKSFIERNPELIKRYWKATIRGYHFMRIVPENFPFQRMVESQDPRQQSRSIGKHARPAADAHHGERVFPARRPTDRRRACGAFWKSIRTPACCPSRSCAKDVEEVVSQDLVKEAWEEISQTDEVKRNLERLQPVVEKYGY